MYVTLGAKAARKSILERHAAERLARRHATAASVLQRHVRGLLVRLREWRRGEFVYASFGQEVVSFKHPVRPWDAPPGGDAWPCRVSASVGTSRWADARAGAVLRAVAERADGAGWMVFTRSVRDVVELLRRPPPRLRGRRFTFEDLVRALLDEEGALCMDPQDSITRREEAVHQWAYYSSYTCAPGGPGPQTWEPPARVLAAQALEGCVATCQQWLGWGRLIPDPLALWREMRAKPGGQPGPAGMQRAYVALAAARHALDAAEAPYVGVDDMRLLPAWCGEQVRAMEMEVLEAIEAVRECVRQQRAVFREVGSGVNEAYAEALEVLRDTCVLYDTLQGRTKALLGPGGERYRIWTYAQALLARKADAHALMKEVNEAVGRVRRMRYTMDQEERELAGREKVLKALFAAREGAGRAAVEGWAAAVREQLEQCANRREEVEVAALRAACARQMGRVCACCVCVRMCVWYIRRYARCATMSPDISKSDAATDHLTRLPTSPGVPHVQRAPPGRCTGRGGSGTVLGGHLPPHPPALQVSQPPAQPPTPPAPLPSPSTSDPPRPRPPSRHCIEALSAELSSLHARMPRLVAAMAAQDVCESVVQRLGRRRVCMRVAYVVHRKKLDYQAVLDHIRRLKEAAERAKQPHFKRVPRCVRACLC
jgi:hypothetical protein